MGAVLVVPGATGVLVGAAELEALAAAELDGGGATLRNALARILGEWDSRNLRSGGG